MHYAKVKGILSPKNGMNLYRGCTHGCIYCDSRSKCYHIDHVFEDIEVKENALELLEEALKKRRKKCMIGTGAMTDPYIPLEMKLRHVRKALELIHQYHFGVTLHTKSTRVLNDLDLIKKINQDTKCVIQMTLTTYDDNLCKIIEPNVSTTRERIEALKILHREGIPTVVWLSPILPFINDTKENILGILNACHESGVKGIICFGMGVTMREGNREYFYQQLDRYFPKMKEKYIQSFGMQYELTSPNHAELMHLFHGFCEKHEIMHDVGQIFDYLNMFEDCYEGEQLMFELPL